ncbi:unnamed protein product [Parascedosporium putredinis]|uniref:AB hydrolase-1 domain-containing protein n=1 Tax=Parascedosporium putredinis TaxID=1442378 RepID=A0A9P1MCR5_9PEZI|nr:unnamed protein product [Parascedosporium putredinis]CAI7998891.1 unnamed protein product [Parascedosporium putredinis]
MPEGTTPPESSHVGKYERIASEPENPFASLIPEQEIAVIPSFTLESGVTLHNVPVAYTTRGQLSPNRDNAMVICHALTGSSDVADWDDVNLHKLILDDLGVRQVAAVIGGSLGGMFVLEWAYLGKEYIRSVVPIATSSRHSAWCISWGEAQRQSIYADPKYDDGYYPFDDPPSTGLGAARMAALLTYRSRNSFESRFGRNIPDPSKRQTIRELPQPSTPSETHFHIHNDGHKIRPPPAPPAARVAVAATVPGKQEQQQEQQQQQLPLQNSQLQRTRSSTGPRRNRLPGESMPSSTYFSAQSYLRYQGQKFVKRFDSNCYIAMTRKLDTHDVSRGRADTVAEALAMIEQPTLVLGIESDGLFTFAEQEELAEHIKNARLERIVNNYILEFLKEALPDIMEREGEAVVDASVGELTKSSTFGEAEVGDLTAW